MKHRSSWRDSVIPTDDLPIECQNASFLANPPKQNLRLNLFNRLTEKSLAFGGAIALGTFCGFLAIVIDSGLLLFLLCALPLTWFSFRPRDEVPFTLLGFPLGYIAIIVVLTISTTLVQIAFSSIVFVSTFGLIIQAPNNHDFGFLWPLLLAYIPAFINICVRLCYWR